jgi:hypothetical protein
LHKLKSTIWVTPIYGAQAFMNINNRMVYSNRPSFNGPQKLKIRIIHSKNCIVTTTFTAKQLKSRTIKKNSCEYIYVFFKKLKKNLVVVNSNFPVELNISDEH